LGKVGYAPNEQMQRGVVFPHSDLYALAATSLVLLTGKEPPELIDPQNFTWNWREYITLSPHLASVLDRMLQLRPNDRFESAQAVLTALETGNVVATPAANPNVAMPPTLKVQPIGSPVQSQTATVVAGSRSAAAPPTTVTSFKGSGLLGVVGKTWLAIAAIIGAIGCGWVVASIVFNKSEPKSAPSESAAPQSSPSPTSVTSNSSSPTPVATTTPTPSSSTATPIAAISPALPAALANKGIDEQAYGAAVKQVFTSQNPNVTTVSTDDNRVRSQLKAIASDLGTKLTNQLNRDAVQRIGKYQPANRLTWRSQVNQLHLSERALIDLTDAKYRQITEFNAQKLGLSNEQFLTTPMGQVYLATMFDRVQAIQSKQASDEIVFLTGQTRGKVSGTLQPGEGKVYIASLGRGQQIAVDITANERPHLSIYPPTSKLPAMLTTTATDRWSGTTTAAGYHEFTIVSHSDRPLRYELQLSTDTLW
jgi:serine/threonine protein kinase, bacterial